MHPRIQSHDGERWTIVDAQDQEHVLFTGTYRECEDWLDHFEVQQQAAQAQQAAPREAGQEPHRTPAEASTSPVKFLPTWLRSLFGC